MAADEISLRVNSFIVLLSPLGQELKAIETDRLTTGIIIGRYYHASSP